jgi:ATPase subunit of ABC transporter with duplicated ATPase domains
VADGLARLERLEAGEGRVADAAEADWTLAGRRRGGERLRAGMACVFARAAPPLMVVLDQPTNHLDLAAVELLEDALSGFDGALVVGSHDAAFLSAIGVTRAVRL